MKPEWQPTVEHEVVTPFVVTNKNGFLPIRDPIKILPITFFALEKLLSDMPLIKDDGTPGLLFTGKFGEAVLNRLPEYDVDNIEDQDLLMALFRDYTFVASAYLLEPADITRRETGTFGLGRNKLPRNVAVPLSKIAEKVQAKPFMEYAQSYALYNYARKDVGKPIEYDNLEVIRKFSGLSSEHGFILVHVDMVARTPKLVENIQQAFDAVYESERYEFNNALDNVYNTMKQINSNMEKMWKRSSPDDYMKFRTFIMGTKNQSSLFPDGVIYEGVSPEPTFYRGESGANDSIIPTMDNFLQLTEFMPHNPMTDILKDFRSYRPRNHTRWLEWVESNAQNLQVAQFARADASSLHWYIKLLDQVREFRSRHWNFAREYIIKKTNYPQATGGSPMATWLPNQLLVVLDQIIDNCLELERYYDSYDEETKSLNRRAILQKEQLMKDINYLSRPKV